ncbi:MAG: HlyD family efflux transporter periplasmic adaptor subunit [Planctomycetales bacterium]|nr:HlyD family efflux transporter periplasmic adaptor subunit [Planctomycetales bacterium]
MLRTLTATLLLAVCAAPLTAADSPSGQLTLNHCVVSLIEEAQLPARKPGALDTLLVEEGGAVQRGQVVARMDARESMVRRNIAQSEWLAAQKEAENDIDVRYSAAAADVAQAEYTAAVQANKRVPGTFAEAEVSRLRLAARRGFLGIDQAQHKFDVTKINGEVRQGYLDAAQLELDDCEIKSPIDGVVVRTFRHDGEWVNVGDPICQIIRLDRLRVTGFVSAHDYKQEEIIGKKVRVTILLENEKGQEPFEGTIGFVSPVVEPGGDYRVWADVENRKRQGYWVLRPGHVAEMAVDVPAVAKKAD